jgi:hypothetical protein
MPITHFPLTQLRALLKTNTAGGSALLIALACSTAMGDKPSAVRTAFRDVLEETPAPPSQPGPAPAEVNHANDGLSTPAAPPSGHYEPHHMHHCCPPPAYTRWPVVGPLHRRWITQTKPNLQASHWGYPEYFEERPYGTYVLQAEQMQIVNGVRDQQVLYDYDFLTGDHAAELRPRGQYQLQKIVRRMEIAPCPIIIQTNTNFPNPELDEARRQHVLDALAAAGVPATPDMVVAGRPPVPGLQGVEGILIYNNLLGQTDARGGGFSLGGDGGGVGDVNIGNVNFQP